MIKRISCKIIDSVPCRGSGRRADEPKFDRPIFVKGLHNSDYHSVDGVWKAREAETFFFTRSGRKISSRRLTGRSLDCYI